MRKDWSAKAFEGCLDRVTYPNKVQRRDFQISGKFPVISQESAFINGYWDNEADVLRVERPIVVFGDHTQVLKYVDFDFVLGADGVKLIKPKNFIDPKFFYYFLMAHPIEGAGYARHYRYLKDLTVRYPALPEQQRIVAILDETFAGLAIATANAEKNLKNARDLFESALNSAFASARSEGVEKKIDQVCRLINGRAYSKKDLLAKGRYPVLRVGNFFTNKNWYYSDLELDPDKYCSAGDLLYAWSASFGPKVWDGGKVIFHYHIWKVEPKADVIRKMFLFYFFEWDKERIRQEQGAGTTMVHVSKESMEGRLIPVPALRVQDQLIGVLDNISGEAQRLVEIYEKKLAALSDLKQSILQRAFSGELTSPPSQAIKEAAE